MNLKSIKLLLITCMFFTGASGLVNEYVLATVSTYILGGSLEQMSMTIALMLGFMGIGGMMQQYVSSKNLIQKFIYLELVLAIIGSFAPLVVYWSWVYTTDIFPIILHLFIFILGFLIGFEIPFIIRINNSLKQRLKQNISSVTAADYIGSMVGATIWTYLLLPNMAIYKISFIVSGTNLFIAFLALLVIKNKWNIKNFTLFFIVFSAIFTGYIKSDKINAHLEQYLYEDPIISSFKTKYQKLTLTYNNKMDEYRFYINGNTQFSSLDEKKYHELLVHPAMSLSINPKNILVIGGGDGMAVRELKKYNNLKITLIDLDKSMIEFAKNNKHMKILNENSFKNVNFLNPDFVSEGASIKVDKDRINVFNIDADKMLWNLKDVYDVVIIDLPDPSTVELAKLYSKEFYLKIKRRLSPNGVIAIQSTSPYHAKEPYLIIGNTLSSAGFYTKPYHANIPSFGEWGWWLASKKDILSEDININIDTTYLTKESFNASKVFGKNELSQKKKDINTLMYPNLYFSYKNNKWLGY